MLGAKHAAGEVLVVLCNIHDIRSKLGYVIESRDRRLDRRSCAIRRIVNRRASPIVRAGHCAQYVRGFVWMNFRLLGWDQDHGRCPIVFKTTIKRRNGSTIHREWSAMRHGSRIVLGIG